MNKIYKKKQKKLGCSSCNFFKKYNYSDIVLKKGHFAIQNLIKQVTLLQVRYLLMY